MLSCCEKNMYSVFVKELKEKYLKPLAYDGKILKIMHGSDNDIWIIKSVFNISFVNFIDTSRLDLELKIKGSIRALATLSAEYLETYMPKDYQVSEWKIRPIPEAMIDYARRDSMVLPFLLRKILKLVNEDKK
jgi:exosome complex exonuclease RRP6